jgi:cytochrome c biogenesis protein
MSIKPKPTSSFKKEFLQFFGSVTLAIVLLLLIAVASIIGTVLPQDQGPAVITNSTFHPVLKQVLFALKAYDVYHAFWFNFLLALLFLNLAVCTYLRFPPTWRRYQMETPPAPPLTAMQEGVLLSTGPDALRLDMLRKRGYRVSAIANGEYFAEKAKFVRLGPTFIHISLFAIIIGAIVGGVTGIKNSVPVMVGQTIQAKDVFDTAYVHGALAPTPSNFSIRLDKFRMDFRPMGMVKQYYSDLTITPEGGTPFKKKIWVNELLVYQGMYFYQSFWGLGGLTTTVDGKKIDSTLQQSKNGYIGRPFQMGGQDYLFFVRDMQQPAILVAAKDVKPVAELMPGMSAEVAGHTVKLEEYQLYSGLETKRDPGIPIVYFGCGILIFGLMMVPVSHREVWVRKATNGWVLAGRTHKGRVMLRNELEHIAKVWASVPATDFTSASPDTGAMAS